MAYEKIDLETPQPNGKVGEPGPTAWAKARRMFVELYKLWQTNPNVFPYFDKDGNPTFATLTEFARSIMDDPDASTVLKTLGVSDFAKTLLDDASASAVLDTLGAGATGKSLLSSANQAAGRTSLGLGSAAIAAVMGAVSQADNSPLMERAATSTGTYFRFRSGVQICFSFAITANPITSSFGSLFRSNSVNWVFPAQFGGEQPPMIFAQDQFEAIWCGCSQGSYTSSNINSIYPISTSGNRSVFACAIGRWY